MVAIGVKKDDDAAAGSRGQVFFGERLVIQGVK
jgi:hypothetical protein